MDILLQQFLGLNHSWSFVSQNISRTLIKLGHNVELFSTNGLKHLPEDLLKNIIGFVDEKGKVNGRLPNKEYDCQISYTAPRNFQNYLSHGSKNRFAIWCYEFAGKNSLPTGFAKNHKFCDKLLPPSNFAKQVFLDSGIPEEKMIVIPHGVDANFSDNTRGKYNLKTKKRFKILVNITQIHIRKNLKGTLAAYGKAFTKKDDVCLVLKISDKKPTQSFELSFFDILKEFKMNFKNHGEIEIINEFITDIDMLYRSCDAVFSLSHSESFNFVALEAAASKKINIVSNYGGHLDFLNNENSLLVDGKEIYADPKALYWESKIGTTYFNPDINDAVDKLRFAYDNTVALTEKFSNNNIIEKYSWDVVVKNILDLIK